MWLTRGCYIPRKNKEPCIVWFQPGYFVLPDKVKHWIPAWGSLHCSCTHLDKPHKLFIFKTIQFAWSPQTFNNITLANNIFLKKFKKIIKKTESNQFLDTRWEWADQVSRTWNPKSRLQEQKKKSSILILEALVIDVCFLVFRRTSRPWPRYRILRG